MGQAVTLFCIEGAFARPINLRFAKVIEAGCGIRRAFGHRNHLVCEALRRHCLVQVGTNEASPGRTCAATVKRTAVQ